MNSCICWSKINPSVPFSLVEELATDPEFIDPSLMILSDICINDYLNLHKDEHISKISKKIKKRIDKYRPLLRDEFMKPVHKRKDVIESMKKIE